MSERCDPVGMPVDEHAPNPQTVIPVKGGRRDALAAFGRYAAAAATVLALLKADAANSYGPPGRRRGRRRGPPRGRPPRGG
jgi:hypothetical protein